MTIVRSEPTGNRFTRAQRLRKPAEFDQTFAGGKRLRNSLLTVVCHPNSMTHPRLGLAIAKKVAPDASQRNRIKRSIREYFRLHQRELGGYDLVVLAQPPAARAARHELTAAVDALWKQLLARCAPR